LLHRDDVFDVLDVLRSDSFPSYRALLDREVFGEFREVFGHLFALGSIVIKSPGRARCCFHQSDDARDVRGL
jgi:hypothetical protein